MLGLNDSIRDAADNPTYPSKPLIDNALNAAVQTGATVIRSHTLGISVGCEQCIQPIPGQFNDAAFAAADYAICRAGQLSLKLMVSLVDQWRWVYGGISQRASEANFSTDPRIIASFQSYVSYLLNHVNPDTGLAYKNDPTILSWETGN